MGFVYSLLGDYSSAVDKLTEALEIVKEENDIEMLAGIYNNFGIALQNAGRPRRLWNIIIIRSKFMKKREI